MNLTAAELAELEAGAPRLGVFFRIDTDPAVRLWLGIGRCEPGVNALDPSGGSYRGFGEITDLPELQHLMDGTADRVTFSISGITPTAFASISPNLAPQQNEITGKSVAVGFALMGSDWQLLGPVRWEWYGFADFISVNHAVAEQLMAGPEWSLSLSAGSWMTGRRRPGRSYWTDQDQQARFPGDRFCERVILYGENEKVWPRF